MLPTYRSGGLSQITAFPKRIVSLPASHWSVRSRSWRAAGGCSGGNPGLGRPRIHLIVLAQQEVQVRMSKFRFGWEADGPLLGSNP
jgi:hypothetical protein